MIILGWLNSYFCDILLYLYFFFFDEFRVFTCALFYSKGPPSPEQEPKSRPVESPVRRWDSKKVQDWLEANKVTIRYKAMKTLNGSQLLQLKKLVNESRPAYHQHMKEDLKVSFPDALSIAAALEKLN